MDQKIKVPFARSYWVMPGKLLAGYYPGDLDPTEEQKKLTGLVNAGIRHVINLMEADETNWHGNPFMPYQEKLREIGRQAGLTVTCVRKPIRDYGIPSRAEMKAILDEIDTAISRGRAVYVHCLGGKGRTGTVVGCYLARQGIAAGEDVLDMIKLLRRNDPEAHIHSPESESQRQMVIQWRVGE